MTGTFTPWILLLPVLPALLPSILYVFILATTDQALRRSLFKSTWKTYIFFLVLWAAPLLMWEIFTERHVSGAVLFGYWGITAIAFLVWVGLTRLLLGEEKRKGTT